MTLDLPAGKIARPIITIGEQATVVDASKKMARNNRGSIVITNRGATVGFLTERDVLRRVVAKSLSPRSVKVKEVMTKTPVTIDKGRPLREAVDLMNRKSVRRMLVTDGGRIVGVFTVRDIVRYMRICVQCGKEISSILETSTPDLFIECVCGSRYHKSCAETVVNCVICSRTLVTNVVYPEPSETFAG
ncbi:MAG TPA: CBS domain-containing protein [Nitrososphaerales archaeon]|nr:CBS domain-containing protein [Nitrososphaerales archaeon]